MFDRNEWQQEQRTEVCEQQALRTKSGDTVDSGGHGREEQQGNRPWGECPPRPGQDAAETSDVTEDMAQIAQSPFPDVTYTFTPNRVSLVFFLLLFGKKRSGYRGQQCSDGSTLYRKLQPCSGCVEAETFGHGQNGQGGNDHCLKITQRGFSAFCAEMSGPSCTLSGGGASPAVVAPSPNVSLSPLLTAGTVFAEALCSAILICLCR